MIECSVFGYLKETDALCRALRMYRRVDAAVDEALYSNGRGVLVVTEEQDGMHLVSREAPDRNRNRMSLCCRLQRARTNTPETLDSLLSALGFSLVRRNRVFTIVFEREEASVEISRIEQTGMYLVKVSAVAESAAEGEKMLSRAVEELEDQVQLIKP